MIRHMYFDTKDYMLRTHVILQEIKRFGGTKVYLEARKLLLVAWLACKEGQGIPGFPTFVSYSATLNNLENVNTRSKKLLHFSSVERIRVLLSFYPDHFTNGYFFTIPYKTFMNKTIHQAHVNVENFILEEKRKFNEELNNEFPMPEPPRIDHRFDEWDGWDDDDDWDNFLVPDPWILR